MKRDNVDRDTIAALSQDVETCGVCGRRCDLGIADDTCDAWGPHGNILTRERCYHRGYEREKARALALQADHDELAAKLHRERAEFAERDRAGAAELRDVLRLVEWDSQGWCIACGVNRDGGARVLRNVHLRSCRLAAALAETCR